MREEITRPQLINLQSRNIHGMLHTDLIRVPRLAVKSR
jgi:hypothetical protein